MNKRSRAFTLIELMIASSLMAMILASAYACFRASYSGRELVETRADIAQSARVALNLIGADLRAAFPLSKQFPFVGMDRMLGEVAADNLDFATHNHSPARQLEGDFCEVSYYLDRNPSTGLYSLWRRRDPSPDLEPFSGGAREEIARGLAGLEFEYYDGLDWYDEWGDPEGRYQDMDPTYLPNNLFDMPDAVRVTLQFDPAGPTPRRPARDTDRSSAESAPPEPEPPIVFQTVFRLNLAPVSITRVTSTSSASGAESDGGTAVPAEGPN